MAFVAVDKDGSEYIYDMKPTWQSSKDYWGYDDRFDGMIELPSGSIRKLIGRELTWDDEPVELIVYTT